MTPTQRAAMEQALEALNDLRGYRQDIDDAIGALVEALAEQSAENCVMLTDVEIESIVSENTTDDYGYDIWCNGKGVARAAIEAYKKKNSL